VNRWQQRAQELLHENAVAERSLHHKVQRVRFSCIKFLSQWDHVNRRMEERPGALQDAIKSASAANPSLPDPDTLLPGLEKTVEEIKAVSTPAGHAPSHIPHRNMLRV
jgi:hypothetical protein